MMFTNEELRLLKQSSKWITTAPAEEKAKTVEPEKVSEPEKPDVPGRKGFAAVAGMEHLKQLVTESFINVLRNKECAEVYGIIPPSILFYGPSGCGKSYFAKRMAEELGIHYMKVVPDDIASTWIHGSQKKISELFRKAEKNAPTLMFLDEFDAMAPKRNGNSNDRLLNCEVNEFLCKLDNAAQRGIYVLAATNHPDFIDQAILRTGRFDEMIYIDMPDYEARKSLFTLSLADIPVEEDVDYDLLAERSSGFNCSDIMYIIKATARKTFNETVRNGGYPYLKVTQKLLIETMESKEPSVNPRSIQEFERLRSIYSPKDAKRRKVNIGFHV